MVIYTKLEINNVEYTNALKIEVDKTMSEFNATGKFVIKFDNKNGQYNNTFSLNQDIEIWADKDITPTTKIFLGIIEKINFKGISQDEKVILTGRDYGAKLQDILVSPRIFKNQEVGAIVRTLILQNASGTGLTTNNVGITTTEIERITFNNITLFDALVQLSEISGYYFFINTDKDLNFVKKDSIVSGETFNNTNVTSSNFKQTDDEIFNRITVFGDRQLTGVRETFSAQAGSVYTLDDKPSNVNFIGSASPNVPIQPGGIKGVANPQTENVQYLVNYHEKEVILASGTTAGDNTGWTGSSVIIDYQRSSPLIAIGNDATSETAYGQKCKQIVDRNIKTQDEAELKASTFLAKYKDPLIEGNINVYGITNVTPGNTAIVNIPFQNISSQTYTILNAVYEFTSRNNLSNQVLNITLNKRIKNFIDYMKDQELRLRNLEGAEVETSITNLESTTGSLSVETSYNVISNSIGSTFYFHLPGHNILNSSTSLIGDMRAGSTVISG